LDVVDSLRVFVQKYASNDEITTMCRHMYLFYTQHDTITRKYKIPGVYAEWMKKSLGVEFDESVIRN